MLARWLGWGLALTLAVAGCSPGSLPEPEPPPEPRAEAAMDGTTARFTLSGYAGEALPRLRLRSPDGYDWAAELAAAGPVRREGERLVLEVDGKARLEKLATDLIAYTWALPDGGEIAGRLIYGHPIFPDLTWQVWQTERLTIHHTEALGDDAEQWVRVLEEVEALTGLRRERPLVIWILPSSRHFKEFFQLPREPRGAQHYHRDLDRVVMTQIPGRSTLLLLAGHEMVHAVAEESTVPWWVEGGATFIERRIASSMGWEHLTRIRHLDSAVHGLHQLAADREYDPTETYGGKYDNPSVLGAAVWLYVHKRFGDEGVHRLFREGHTEEGARAVLEELSGQSLEEFSADWNAYLESPEIIADWTGL